MEKRTVVIALLCLAISFIAGWLVRGTQMVSHARSHDIEELAASAPAPGIRSPTPDEANAALRRHHVPLASLAHARVTLGTCVPSTLAELSCAADLVWDERQHPAWIQHRTIGFSRMGGRWEVTLW